MTSDNRILAEFKDNVGVLTINRPEVHNALDLPTLLELKKAFEAFLEDTDARVIVVTGVGERAFVAGTDIADMNARQILSFYLEFSEVNHRVFRHFETRDKPTIAAVNGWVLGGGTELVLSLDIRILADGAKLDLPEITLGLFPGAGGTQRLPRQIPLPL